MDSGLHVDESTERMAKEGNSTSMFLTPADVLTSPNATSSLLGSGDHSAFITMGTVIGAVVAVIALVAAILTVCLRPCRRPTEPDREQTPEKTGRDEEHGVSKQIVEIEQFRVLSASPDEITFTTSCDETQDSSHSRSSRSTLEISSDLSWDSSYDYMINTEPDLGVFPWTRQSDADRSEESECRTWLLESVGRLEVIEEEPEEDLSHDSVYTSSPHSGGTASSSDYMHTNSSCSDDSLAYQSCRDIDSDSVLDTAYSENTNTDYKTCSENLHVGFSRNSLSATHLFQNSESPSAKHPSKNSGNPHSEPSSDSERLSPWFLSNHSPSSGSEGTKDDSHSSGTSGEVSSGCFDLSYVTFHTLPLSSNEDSGLQALYACFDPSLRRPEPAMSRQSSPKSLAGSPPKCCEYSPVRAE